MHNNSKKYINLVQVLMEGKVHLGHSKSSWNPKMSPYILSEYKDFHIINLETTIPLLKKALNIIKHIYEAEGNILVVGNSNVNKGYVLDLVKNKNIYGVSGKWTGGSLTNWNPNHFDYTKVNNEKPNLIIVLNCKGNETVFKEATKSGIPVIAILDTDTDYTGVQYPIPGNDDSPQAQYIYYKLILNALRKNSNE